MRFSGKAPTMIVWIISLVLYLVALAAHFGVAGLGGQLAAWSWIIGFGLLLIACKVRGLWPFIHFNRMHVVPPCTVSPDEAREGIAIIDEALSVADQYYEG